MNDEEATRSEPDLPPPTPTPLGLDRDLAFAEAERRLLGRELTPVTLDRFVVLHRLGQGAMGVVYAAHDPKLDRKVALKLVDTSGFGSEGVLEAQDRLEREARAAADLAHPNIVTIYDTGRVGDQVFLAMELVQGGTLRKWLREGSRSWREIVTLFIAIGEGLAAAHDKGIVHRDFKPDNVLVGDDGRPRVVDFGLARPVAPALQSTKSIELLLDGDADGSGSDSGPGSATRSPDTSIAGTPAYMAPEQYAGRNVGPHSDQFGFCVALYEALLSERPFRGATPTALANAVMDGQRQPLPRGHGVPPSVLAVVMRGLSQRPQERHRSMHHLVGALRRARDLRRRQVGMLLGSGALAAAVLSTYALTRGTAPEAPDPCEGVDRPLHEVWNDSRRDAIGTAMAASSPFAAGAWTGIEAKLDRFAEHWSRQRTEACETAQHKGEESVLLLELRYACLDRELGRVDAFLEELERPGPAVALSGPAAADALDRLWRCEDRERLVTLMHANGLANETDLSRNAEGLQRWRAGFERLARAEMLHRLGDTEAAQREARGVMQEAHDAGLRGLEAEARLEVGRWAHDVEELERALDLAVAASPPSQAAEIGMAIAEQATAPDGGDPEVAREHLRYAERFLARAGRNYEGPLAVRIPDVRGRLAMREGDLDGARRELENALAEARKRLPADHTDMLVIRGNLAVALTKAGDTAAATAMYEELLEAQRRVLGPSHPDVGATAFNLGNAALEDRRLADARRWFEEARRVWTAAFGEGHVQVSFPLGALGEVARRRGELEDARRLQLEALQLREGTLGSEHPALCDVLDELGEIAREQGDLGSAEEQLRRSLGLRRSAGDPRVDVTLTKLGRVLVEAGKREEGIAMLEEAIELRSKAGVDPLKRAETELVLARVMVTEDRTRAKALAEAAVARLQAEPGRRSNEREEAERWLAETFGVAGPCAQCHWSHGSDAPIPGAESADDDPTGAEPESADDDPSIAEPAGAESPRPPPEG
ncbi:MAG: tetratricopeptide repeat protein [Myxococcales bacterium]|nr:tetratricopeptide repeat protein [Myxococcales bacterium]